MASFIALLIVWNLVLSFKMYMQGAILEQTRDLLLSLSQKIYKFLTSNTGEK